MSRRVLGQMTPLREQLRKNAMAIASMVVALVGFSYNTWRDERTEYNRNVRAAGFEILTRLADFERVVFLAHYDRDKINGNPRTGWSYVIVINDLAEIVPGTVQPRAVALRDAWRANWERLGTEDETAGDRVDAGIADLRQATLEALHSLR
jgi:hypothetical protein